MALPGMLYGKVAASSDGRNSDLVKPLGLPGGPRPWIESVSIDSDVVLRKRYGELADLPVSACIVATVSKTLPTAEYQVSVVIASRAGSPTNLVYQYESFKNAARESISYLPSKTP